MPCNKASGHWQPQASPRFWQMEKPGGNQQRQPLQYWKRPTNNAAKNDSPRADNKLLQRHRSLHHHPRDATNGLNKLRVNNKATHNRRMRLHSDSTRKNTRPHRAT